MAYQSSGSGYNSASVRQGALHSLPQIDLPPRTIGRWVIAQKAKVVGAVQHGVITLDEACERYNLTVEEFLSWQKRLDETPNWQKKYLNN
jgi:hypothetical protein